MVTSPSGQGHPNVPHYWLVHLHQGTKMIKDFSIVRTSKLRVLSPKVVCHKDLIGTYPVRGNCDSPHLGNFHDGTCGFYKCGQMGHFLRDFPMEARTQVVKFLFPNDPVLEWESSTIVPKGRFISYLKAKKLVSNGWPLKQMGMSWRISLKRLVDHEIGDRLSGPRELKQLPPSLPISLKRIPGQKSEDHLSNRKAVKVGYLVSGTRILTMSPWTHWGAQA
ncbi:hypothetical protein MTR67_018254 [Solanum verrucosum]|uniref:Uncharacterized protein n=1 Tax=Solanum verrucosum TaxID=315347 RepID=A0AAF0QJD3_SOLVR|nr:hypothetical protein MTR67_018254 [Solanum verrucosum]